MRDIHHKDVIFDFFSRLNEANLDYVLLRNSNNELPSKLKKNKDIDLWVALNNRERFIKFLKKNNFRKIRHPLRKYIRLYGVSKFEMFINKFGLIVDINYEICVKSLSKLHLVPIDEHYQRNILKNFKKIYFSNVPIKHIGDNEYHVLLIARHIFDKESFSAWSISEINKLSSICNSKIVYQYLKLIFFSFTDELLNLINKRRYNFIHQKYIEFKKY